MSNEFLNKNNNNPINDSTKKINYGRHFIDDDDINAVIEVLKSDFLTCGPKVSIFEKDLCKFTGYNYATICNSGTSALYTAVKICKIGPGDEIIIPGLTFIATASVVEHVGAKCVFCDIDVNTGLIDIGEIKKLITKKTKAIICVDYAGQQCNYEEIIKFAHEFDIRVISDACHSFGAVKKELNNAIADITCYSFHPVKSITTGEGGAILTNNKIMEIDSKLFINHGQIDNRNRNNYYAEFFFPGMNFRMSDINAALGISQLKKQEKLQKIRENIATIYNAAFKECNFEIIKKVNKLHMYHLYVIKVNNRDDFLSNMYFSDIKCNIHYNPVYKQIAFSRYRQEAEERCKNIESIWNKIVSIPLHACMSGNDIKKVINNVKKFANGGI